MVTEVATIQPTSVLFLFWSCSCNHCIIKPTWSGVPVL